MKQDNQIMILVISAVFSLICFSCSDTDGTSNNDKEFIEGDKDWIELEQPNQDGDIEHENLETDKEDMEKDAVPPDGDLENIERDLDRETTEQERVELETADFDPDLSELDNDIAYDLEIEMEPESEEDLYEGNCEEYMQPRGMTACWNSDHDAIYTITQEINGEVTEIGQEPESDEFCSFQSFSTGNTHSNYPYEPGSKFWFTVQDNEQVLWTIGLLGVGLAPLLTIDQHIQVTKWQEPDWGLGWLDLYVEDELVYHIFNTSTAPIAEGLQHPDDMVILPHRICEQTRGTQANGETRYYHELWVKHEQCWYVLQPGEVRYISNTDWVVVFEQSSSISVWGEDNPYNDILYTHSPVALYKVDSDPTGTPLLNGFTWSNAPCQPVEE